MQQPTSAFPSAGTRSSVRSGHLEMAQVSTNVRTSCIMPNEPNTRASSFYGSSYTQSSYIPPPPAQASPQIPPPAQSAPNTTFRPDVNNPQARPNSSYAPSYIQPPHIPLPAPIPPSTPTPAYIPPPQPILGAAFRLDSRVIVEQFIEERRVAFVRLYTEKLNAARERGASEAEIEELIKELTLVGNQDIAQTRADALALITRVEAINANVGDDQQPPPAYEQAVRERHLDEMVAAWNRGLGERLEETPTRTQRGMMLEELDAKLTELKRLRDVWDRVRVEGNDRQALRAMLNYLIFSTRTLLELEEATDCDPAKMAEYKRKIDIMERANRATDLGEQNRLLSLIDMEGISVEKEKESSACSWVAVGVFFLFGLSGMATEMALSILISQGTQSTSLDPSLVAQITCENLGTKSGSCDPPEHWSLFFGYGSPVLIIITLFWITCCDRKGKYNFTSYASIAAVGCAIAAVVGSTLLSVKGYSKSDCSSCPQGAVFVPLPKLRMMNRGQAAGSYFAVIGLAFALLGVWAA